MYPFQRGMFAPKNAWYVAALSREVTRQPVERWFLDEPVVMFRREDGTAVALAGRCPHRQFPMAAGLLKGDELTCGYHGITFDADGRCTRIPVQERVPPAFCLRRFPLVEKWQWMWIWMGDSEKADEALIPDHDELELLDAPNAEGHRSIPMFHFEVKGRYQFLHDNLLDLSHLAYLHGTSIGTEAIATTRDEVTVGKDWVRSIRRIRGAAPTPVEHQTYGDVRVDSEIDFTFKAPALHVGYDTARIAGAAPDDEAAILRQGIVYHAITPAQRNSCHYFFANTTKRPAIKDADVEWLTDMIGGVIHEDIFATEEIERIVGDREDLRDLMTEGDTAVVRGRLMLQRMMKAEMESATL